MYSVISSANSKSLTSFPICIPLVSFCCFIALARTWSTGDVQKSSFNNSPEWRITKVYLFGDKLTERVAIHSPLHIMGTGTESSSQEGHTCFLSAFIVHETMPKIGQYLKDYLLKKFPKHHPLFSKPNTEQYAVRTNIKYCSGERRIKNKHKN